MQCPVGPAERPPFEVVTRYIDICRARFKIHMLALVQGLTGFVAGLHAAARKNRQSDHHDDTGQFGSMAGFI
jgi:hypothetical protein